MLKPNKRNLAIDVEKKFRIFEDKKKTKKKTHISIYSQYFENISGQI
jgi:hypothetical protein